MLRFYMDFAAVYGEWVGLGGSLVVVAGYADG